MSKNINHIQHVKSSVLESDGSPRYPSADKLVDGEIGVNYGTSGETLFIKNSNGVVVPFSSDAILENRFATKEWVREYFVPKPVTIWETDGKSGLLGVNDGTMKLNSWQLENLDFSPYKYVICYFKQADRDLSALQVNYCTPSLMIGIPLDAASLSTGYTAYVGGVNATNPNDRNVNFCVLVAIDATKTKFKVLSEHSIYGTALGGRNDNGRYCYKIVGHFY